MAISCFSQPVPSGTSPHHLPVISTRSGLRPGATEICGNSIDDDGNGLIDDNDFSCYYKSTAAGCPVTSVIWVNTSSAVYWVDPVGGTSKMVGPSASSLLDIAWLSTGHLYSIDGAGIMELDPNTGLVLSANAIPGYTPVNAMTGDARGNLYLTATVAATQGPPGAMYVIKYSPATGQVTPIVNLTAAQVGSGGDLTFLNGKLYLSCGSRKVAAIDPVSGSIAVITINSTVNYSGYGLVTLGDGYLYITHNNSLYRVDPATWQGDATPFYNFPTSGVGVNGLSTYAEHCNAPSCGNPGIVVTIAGGPPYCTSPGVALKATGSGVTGQTAIDWTLPNGTKSTGATLLATIPGVYTARYHNVPDDCGHDTTFTLNIIPSPHAYMGNDTLLCQGGTIKLAPKDPNGITSWLWQDGTTTTDYLVSSPGTYTLQVSNACGVSTAAVQVQLATVPVAQLGPDAAICPGTSTKLYNYQAKQPWDVYSWSVGSTADTIVVSDADIYWVQSENVCGKSRDSMVLTIKDSCLCAPFYARVTLPDDTEMCSFDSLHLKNGSHIDGFRYRWQDGSTGSELMARSPGIYWVDVSTWCGTVRDSIVILPKQKGCERSVHVPNAFSPDGKGGNEIFRPVITGALSEYEFMVYNRWGQLLFHTTNRQKGWDGRAGGNPQVSGVFVWSCKYRFSGQPATLLKGTVLLVR